MRLTLIALLAAVSALHAQTNDAWKNLNFLLGDWVGIGGQTNPQLGAGQGSFSFKSDLKEKIIIRRNNAQYDSGAQHDDLMVIYLGAAADTPRAIYFDSEGHVIRYTLSFPSPQRVVFESEDGQPGPKYRLSYWIENSSLNGRFEIAAAAGDYKTYLSWKSKKQ